MQKIRRTGYILIALLVGASTAAFAWKPAPVPRFTGLASIYIPAQVDGYRCVSAPVDAETKAALVSAQVAAWRYFSPNGSPILLDMIGGTDRSALHDPRSCLVGAGWQVADDRIEQLAVPGRVGVPARTCVATIDHPAIGTSAGFDIVYLYVMHRQVIASATQIRLTLLESALLEQNDSPVYFIRLMTPLVDGPGHAAEHSSLIHFADEFWNASSPSIMKGERA